MNKFTTTLDFSAKLDQNQKDVSASDIDQFFNYSATVLKMTAPPGANVDYKVEANKLHFSVEIDPKDYDITSDLIEDFLRGIGRDMSTAMSTYAETQYEVSSKTVDVA